MEGRTGRWKEEMDNGGRWTMNEGMDDGTRKWTRGETNRKK